MDTEWLPAFSCIVGVTYRTSMRSRKIMNPSRGVRSGLVYEHLRKFPRVRSKWEKESLSHSDKLLCRHDSTLADLKRRANASFHLPLCLRDWIEEDAKISSRDALTVGVEKTIH